MGVEWYGLDGQPISISEANELLGNHEARRVGFTEVGPYVVSTVFLVLDHGWRDDEPPVLFETMVFTKSAWEDDSPREDPDHELLLEFDCRRYHTLAEAQAGHEEMCLLIRATISEVIPSADPCTTTCEEAE